MADIDKTPAMLDQLAALNAQQRREVAKGLRTLAETFAEVPDGRDTAQSARDEAFTLVRSVAQWLLR